MRRRDGFMDDLINGAIAGLVATWVMGKVTTRLYENEDKAVRRREDRLRNGRTAYEAAAERIARLAGYELNRAERRKYGVALHWALGIGTGALYGVLRSRVNRTALGRGLGFGTAFWLLADEAAIWALRLAPGPTRFPWQSHARGLAGHLTYGAVADATLTALGNGRREAGIFSR